MPPGRSRNLKLEQLTKKQVHAMALENLKQHLQLKASGEKSSPERVVDVLLAAAANNTSIEHECDSQTRDTES